MIVTNDDNLAARAALIRNHAESVVEGMRISDIANMIGFNFRMTEIEAAIAYEQLDLLDTVINEKQRQANILDSILGSEPGLTIQAIPANLTSAYYVYPIQLDIRHFRHNRKKLIERINGRVPLVETYQNIHFVAHIPAKNCLRDGGLPGLSVTEIQRSAMRKESVLSPKNYLIILSSESPYAHTTFLTQKSMTLA